MPWLDRIKQREVRRLARNVRHTVIEARDRAEDYAQRVAHQTSAVAGRAAHQFADYGRHEGAIIASVAAQQAGRAGRAIKADPVPVIVGAIGVALLVNLVFCRR